MMMENGHGRSLSSAGALGGMAGEFLSMYIGSARGMPSRLTCASVEMMLWGLSLVGVVRKVPVSVIVTASADKSVGLEWTKFVLVFTVWSFGSGVVGADLFW